MRRAGKFIAARTCASEEQMKKLVVEKMALEQALGRKDQEFQKTWE